MRISDWSSDVCSSDLRFEGTAVGKEQETTEFRQDESNAQRDDLAVMLALAVNVSADLAKNARSRAKFEEALMRIQLRGESRQDRKSVVEGKGGSVRGESGGGRIVKNKQKVKPG